MEHHSLGELNLASSIVKVTSTQKGQPIQDIVGSFVWPDKIATTNDAPAPEPLQERGKVKKRQRDSEKWKEKRKDPFQRMQCKAFLNTRHIDRAVDLPTNYDHSKSMHSKPAYIGKASSFDKVLSLEELIEQGFSLKHWCWCMCERNFMHILIFDTGNLVPTWM